MEEKKFIILKKEEFGIKEYIKKELGKGKISRVNIEYTPVGEKIIISTGNPGFIIGRSGEKIEELTRTLKKRFKLENPHIEIKEIENLALDARIVADDIALSLERSGNLKFKVIAYRKLMDVMKAGALGCEFRLSGKLPSDRAKSWRFAQGYLKKSGDSAKEVDRAKSVALTRSGIIGIKVAITPPNAKIYDRIDIDDNFKQKINLDLEKDKEPERKKIKKTSEKKSKKSMIVREQKTNKDENSRLE